MKKVFWIACYIIGGFFGLMALGGWVYCAYNVVRMGMLGRSRTMTECWPYYRRMLIGLAIMLLGSIIGALLFNPAAEYLFGP